MPKKTTIVAREREAPCCCVRRPRTRRHCFSSQSPASHRRGRLLAACLDPTALAGEHTRPNESGHTRGRHKRLRRRVTGASEAREHRRSSTVRGHADVARAHAGRDLPRVDRQGVAREARAGHLQAAETYMRLALKSQSQCRTTVETLAEIKNPRQVAFVKQANIAGGQSAGQQWRRNRSRGKTKSRQANFWRHSMANGWTPERRQRQAAAHQELATVGTVDGANNPTR